MGDEGTNEWLVIRSRLDPHVWAAMPSGFGDQSAWLYPGPLGKVKRYVEMVDAEVVGWERVDENTWKGVWAS